MALANIAFTDTFDQWRIKTNQLIDAYGRDLLKFTSNTSSIKLTNTAGVGEIVFLDVSPSQNVLDTVSTNVAGIRVVGNTYAFANAAFLQANSVALSANIYTVSIGAASNTWANNVGVAGNNYSIQIGAASNTWANNVNTVLQYQIDAGNNYTDSVGAASNTWANTQYTNALVSSNNSANSSNAYAVTVGTSGNNYAISVGAASNTWANTVNTTVGYRLTAGNNYAISVGAASNTWANTQYTNSLVSANNSANSSNAYIDSIALAGNNWTNTQYTNSLVSANNSANSSNAYTVTVGAAANTWANTKLANTSGITFAGDLAFTGNIAIGTAITASYPLYTSRTATSVLLASRSESNTGISGQRAINDLGVAASYVDFGIGGSAHSSVPNTAFIWLSGTTSPNLVIRNATSEIFKIVNDGRIGLGGITTPTTRLDIEGSVNVSNSIVVSGVNVIPSFAATNNYTVQVGAASNTWANTTGNVVRAFANGTANSSNSYAITVGAASNTWANGITGVVYALANNTANSVNSLSVIANSSITVYDNTSTDSNSYYLTFTTASSGTIGAINVATTKLTFNPSSGAVSATHFNSLSDRALKDNIISIVDPVNKIEQMNGYSFRWKESGNQSYGVIAQELEQVVPELVDTINNDRKTVNYDGIIAFLIEAVKELNDRVKELEKKQQ